MSALRKVYMARFGFRCLALLIVTAMLKLAPGQFDVFYGQTFFKQFSLLHLLWAVWMIDMLMQLIPLKSGIVALGSQKSFSRHFRAAASKATGLKDSMKVITKRAYTVFFVWLLLTLVLGVLHAKKILGSLGLLWISVFFYVCDLICVLFWCPFRQFIMKNRCCTTCRIFNWDHLMMFSPLIFVDGFFAKSLVFMAVVVFLVWEITALCHPERFVESTNCALKCSECTDRLCIQAKKIHKT